jgi:hypothetical protein
MQLNDGSLPMGELQPVMIIPVRRLPRLGGEGDAPLAGLAAGAEDQNGRRGGRQGGR